MRATPAKESRTGINTLTKVGLLLWTGYSFIQQFRQAQPNAITILQPLWLYRVVKHDRTATTDAILSLGLYVLRNGLHGLRDAIYQAVPSWILEDRVVELQIFGMVLVMVALAGLVAYRGEDAREKSETLSNYVLIPSSLLLLVSALWLNNIRTIQDVLRVALPGWILEERQMELQVFSTTLMLAALAGIIVWRGDEKPHIKFVERTRTMDEEYLLPPMLIPGKTTHTRLFPEKHSFDYSYLSVGVPVGWTGRAGSALSCDVNHLPSSKRQRGWFDVDAKDYLSRDEHNCLEHKLGQYLQEQGVSDDDWSSAYLVTAPRFLGYSSNPVSFWYIYDDDSHLTMMILEVNNTFGERRMYLLKSQGSTKGDGIPTVAKEDAPVDAIKFSNAWRKDFHVSPFNDREGSYSLTATDPVASLKQGHGEIIDNVIQLKTPDGKTKLVARVFSMGTKDPATIGNFELFIFLTQWFWVGFVTFPRILRQAWTLYFKKRLQLWFKPEILPSSIGRRHIEEEATLEAFFRVYIQNLVSSSPRPLRLLYSPPSGMSAPHAFVSSGVTSVDEAETPDITLSIISPTFYSRFVHYSHTREALDREGLATDEKNRTLTISNPSLFHELLESAKLTDDVGVDGRRASVNVLEKARWWLACKLRHPPPAVSYPPPPAGKHVVVEDIRASPPSALDLFVQRNCKDANVYRAAITKLFLAERCVWGFPALLELADLIVRTGVINEALLSPGRWGVVNAANIWSLVKGL